LTSEDVSIELHATFRRFEDAAGIELCELLNEYESKQPHPKFKLFVRYSDLQQAKWNRSYLASNLNSQVSKLFVCGPQNFCDSIGQQLKCIFGETVPIEVL